MGSTSDTTQTQDFYSNPLTLTNIDQPGLKIAQETFSGKQFRVWKKSFLLSLAIKNKIAFLNGKIPKPDPTDSTCDAWERNDRVVKAWILNGLDSDIKRTLLYKSTSKEVWENLCRRFDDANVVSLFKIQKELSSISQGEDTVSNYFTCFKELWEEYASLEENPNCTCTASQDWVKKIARQELIFFLFGLNEEYTAVSSNILMLKPIPTAEDACGMICQEESQRSIRNKHSGGSEGMAMQAGSMTGSGSFVSQNSTGYGHQRTNLRRNMVCTYCKKPGHLKSQCYKLVGYPENLRNQRNKRYANVCHGQERMDRGIQGSLITNEESIAKIGLTNKQFEDLCRLMQSQKFKDEDESTTSFSGMASSSEKRSGLHPKEALGSWREEE